MGELIAFTTPEKKTAEGYLAKAADKHRALVIIQEWWGLNDQIKGVADRYAVAGFTALAPDLYDGRVTESPDEAAHLMDGLDWVNATEQEVRGAAQFLKRDYNKVGVMGFCMGGALTIIAGVKLSDVDAAVCFYGIPPATAADPQQIRVPFQGHFATQDDWCTPASVDALEAQLTETGVTYELHRYDAQHGFFNEGRPDVYNERATQLAFERSVTFLSKHL